MKVFQFPLAKITLGLILGILLETYIQLNFFVLFGLFTISLSTFIFTFFLTRIEKINPIYFGIATCFLSINIGMTTLYIHTETINPKHYSNFDSVYKKKHLLKLNVREKLRSTTFYDRYVVILHTIDNSFKTGKILLNINKDSLKQSMNIGSYLKVYEEIYPLTKPINPNQFDYGKYLKTKNIYGQIFTEKSKIILGSKIKKDIWFYTSRLRNKIIRNLESSNFNKKELSVAIALILGQQTEISKEIIEDYQYAGAVHILSVSGLHIGFILIFLNHLLKPIANTNRGRLIKLIITLVSLWTFGLISGLSASVVRSVTMFSFVAIGIYLRRSTNIFHTLLISILFILLIQPSFLFDVGFQLSYLAVFFILWLQPLLAQIWSPKSRIAKYFWDILTVSFAAQIGTFPLSLYYFHQFPGLFFVTNLIIIPFLSVIMALGVLVMILASINGVPLFLAKLLEQGIYLLNKIIHSIASLEQFIFKDIAFNEELLLSSYILLVAIIVWFKKTNINNLFWVLFSVIIFQISWFSNQWKIQSGHELIIFNSNKKSLIVERYGEKMILYSKGSQLQKPEKNKEIIAYQQSNFNQSLINKPLKNLLFFKENKILIVDSSGIYPKYIRPDIVLLTQSPKINFERFLKNIKPKMIIADGSNNKNIQKLWEVSCSNEKIDFHNTHKKGYFILK